jgi:type IV pilus assembly protein PilO
MMKKKKISLKLDSLNPFIEKIEQLSKAQRICIYIGTLVAIIGFFTYFSYLPKHKDLDRLNKQHATLEKKLKIAKGKARQLKKYRAQMKQAEVRYQKAKQALPEKKEIPKLLAAISQTGQDAGLDFLLFQPKPEVRKNFYAEIPVSIKVKGNYREVALFFEKVSELPRIVNLRDISLVPVKNDKDVTLDTSCTAVTYKFVEAKKTAPKVKKRQKNKKKK